MPLPSVAGSMSLAIWEMHTESGLSAAELEMTDQSIVAVVVNEKNNAQHFLGSKAICGFEKNFHL